MHLVTLNLNCQTMAYFDSNSRSFWRVIESSVDFIVLYKGSRLQTDEVGSVGSAIKVSFLVTKTLHSL